MKRSIRLAAVAAATLLFARTAQARFIDGYLAQCTAVAAGACTENTASGYARQPIGFSVPIKAVSVNTAPYTFGSGGVGSIAGHAIYDAPTGGNLLEVLPIAAVPTFSASNPDAGDVGALSVTYTAVASYYDAGAYSGSITPGGSVGTTPDGSAVTTGSGLNLWRGIVSPVTAATDTAYRVVTQTTGFAAVVPAGVTTYVVTGAGTLASGSIATPLAPADGQIMRVACTVTVTALSVTASSGQTLLGSVTTCGPSVGHQWLYAGGTVKTWFMLGS